MKKGGSHGGSPSHSWRSSIGVDVYTISDLKQVRVLADPFRLKLLGAFGSRPKTTKQVAQQLGEKPTKLYHHVEALKRVGLLVLTETRPNRGTVEKYYQAVAIRFRIGAALISPGENTDPMADETSTMLMSILDTTRAELAEVLNQSAGRPETCSANSAMVARMLLRGQPKHIERFRARLLALLELFKAETAGLKPDKEADSYGLTLAFYPVPKTAQSVQQHQPDAPAPGHPSTGRRRPAKPV
jgi:Helix-turn-helix domain